jgi:hypothetical protein
VQHVDTINRIRQYLLQVLEARSAPRPFFGNLENEPLCLVDQLRCFSTISRIRVATDFVAGVDQ